MRKTGPSGDDNAPVAYHKKVYYKTSSISLTKAGGMCRDHSALDGVAGGPASGARPHVTEACMKRVVTAILVALCSLVGGAASAQNRTVVVYTAGPELLRG